METVGNYTRQPERNFPLDCETLEALQRNAAVAAIAGNAAGDRVILRGCEESEDGRERGPGWVFMRTRDYPEGEVIRWDGGPTGEGMYVRKEAVRVEAQGYDYAEAYTRRSLAPGYGEESYSWDDFRAVMSNVELTDAADALRGMMAELRGACDEPAGVVKLWAGGEAPAGYVVCDGRQLEVERYKRLYAAIGMAYSGIAAGVATKEGFFRVPDLRGRFVVGVDERDADYERVGTKGGEKLHRLTKAELAMHRHAVLDYYLPEKTHSAVITDKIAGVPEVAYGQMKLHGIEHETKDSGAGAGHENRPPYYALVYIIKC